MSEDEKKATTKKSTKKTAPKKSQSTEKKEMPFMYEAGEIKMPSMMITDEEAFKKIWKGNLKTEDLDKAWQKAKKWRAKYAD